MSEAVSETEGRRRLEVLCALLDTVPPKRFDYTGWTGKDWGGAQDLSCGTTACAFGWACTIPEFQALGLELRPSKNLYVGGIPTFGGECMFSAASNFFGVPMDVAFLLFDPDSNEANMTAQEVAAKIRSYLKHGPPPRIMEENK